jgi:2-succinyl-5-enolpyruvyl-6-hydroxy-3-cyclohexene-1-carboxylate synthase
MSEANLQTEWAALLFKSLADAGIRDVVISPGSRSTPFVIAAVREPRITRHEAIDERAAAFFALGQARVTGRPSVLVCTSGTAAAHYLPAIIEAKHTGTPMIVLSGDRPPELYDCSAPQTIDQVKLFGDNVSHFFDLVPHSSAGSLRALRRVAVQAVLASSWPNPGAVHVNARARKPLEPVVPSTEEEILLASNARAIAAEPITAASRPTITPGADAIHAAVAVIRGGQRGVIVAGPAAVAQRSAREAVWELARASGFAVACEATSQLRHGPKPADFPLIDGFELLLRSKTFRGSAPFDVAIQLGAPPTSGPWEQIAPSLPRVVIAEQGWPDPHSTARAMVFGDVAQSCSTLAAALRAAPGRAAEGFHERLSAANVAAWRAAETTIGASEHLVEAAALRSLMDRAPERSLLVLSNSLTVRLVDIYARALDRDLDVLSQRGASGIDGLIAGAAGAALSAGRPLAIAIGDVSLLHDVSSLSLAARVRTPLVVFLLHNGGGRIFEQLPIVDVPNIEREIVAHATTPHDTDFAPAAALYGVRYARAKTLSEVDAALDAAYAHPGCTLVEVRVEPSGAIALSRRVAAAVDAAVAPLVRGTP